MTIVILLVALVLLGAALATRRRSVHRRHARADQRESQSRAVRESSR